MGVETYSTTPASNTTLFPEGMTPGAVNDSARQIQADVRALANDIGWFEYGSGSGASAITYLSSTSFRVPSGDHTAVYHVGRRVRGVGSSTGTIYGRITTTEHSGGNTDVTASWDSGGLANETPLAISLAAPYTGQPVGPASTDYAGIIELATSAEAQSGGSSQRALTPASLGALFTAGSPGKIIHPGGLMEQWGIANGGDVVTFATPFTTLYGVNVTPNLASPGFVRFALAENYSTTGFTIAAYTDGGAVSGVRCFWQAKGLA